MTGANRSAPTTALEAMMNLPPLHYYIMKEAAASAFRDTNRLRYKPGDHKGHLKIHSIFSAQLDPNTISDIMPARHNFERPIDLTIPERRTWSDRDYQQGSQTTVFYTDGSRKDGKVGIGIAGPGIRLQKSLGSSPTIFQAEVHAIEVCAGICLRRGDLKGKHICIASDSQAALRAITSPIITSRLVSDCLDRLLELATACRLSLRWVPGHSGVEGNELADELAKKGSEGAFYGPEPFCGYGISNLKQNLSLWEDKRKEANLEKLSSASHSRHLITYSRKRTEEYLQLDKKSLSSLTAILTGHCGLKAHLHRIGKAQDGTCRLCSQEEETPIHLLRDCDAVARARLTHLGETNPTDAALKSLDPKRILSFFHRLNLDGI
jgi:ribonuclease HI